MNDADAYVTGQQNRAAHDARRMIRASEIGQYAYCARAWWLDSVTGAPLSTVGELQRGAAAHRRHGQMVWLARVLVVAAAALSVTACVLLLLSIVR